jgi:hypothetical protein
MSPANVLLDKSKISRLCKFQMQLGSSPNIWLCDRSNICNLLVSWQKVDMVPVRLLSDKMRYLRGDVIHAGSSPSRWLLLMSMDSKNDILQIPNGITPVK